MNKTILIIGAGPGVGLAVAERFGKEGYNVALVARNKEKLHKYEDQLTAKGISAAIFPADILKRDELVEAISAAKSHFGTIDVMEFSPSPTLESMRTPRNIDVENEQYHLNLQVLSAITAVQAVLPDMLKRKEGSLLFTAAASAQKPVCMTASAGIAMGAQLNYVRVLNKDLASENIFAGIISVAGIISKEGQDSSDDKKHFPKGVSIISSKDIAEAHWQMHINRHEYEIIFGDMDTLAAM